MPSKDENFLMWNNPDNWKQGGNEWSEAWGGPDKQWEGAILPRIRNYLPAKTILEIAPGYGRWTQYLRKVCDRLIIVDLAPNCIENCRRRFLDSHNIEYHVNDGQSLDMVTDGLIDFAFSFDSLVHAEMDVIDSYIRELARVLNINGTGFFHHSNLGALNLIDEVNWRASSVSAETVRKSIALNGLHCISQEIVPWGNIPRLDCFTTISKIADKPTIIFENPKFSEEASYIARTL